MAFSRPFLNFVEETDPLDFNEVAVQKYEDSFNREEDIHPILFDRDYKDYLRLAYGKRLANCWFRTDDGQARQIQRIFSFANKQDLFGLAQESWRSPGDIRLDYSVPYFESLMSNWVEHPTLIPFAGIATEEMAEYDMLCFDYDYSPRPIVVLWRHSENAYSASKTVSFIARNFTELQNIVFALPEHLIIDA